MSAPSLRFVMQTPQREFAGAKVLLFSDICKKNCKIIVPQDKKNLSDLTILHKKKQPRRIAFTLFNVLGS